MVFIVSQETNLCTYSVLLDIFEMNSPSLRWVVKNASYVRLHHAAKLISLYLRILHAIPITKLHSMSPILYSHNFSSVQDDPVFKEI